MRLYKLATYLCTKFMVEMSNTWQSGNKQQNHILINIILNKNCINISFIFFQYLLYTTFHKPEFSFDVLPMATMT
jgi:hypothetical protein